MLRYLYDQHCYSFEPMKAKFNAEGERTSELQEWTFTDQALIKPAKFIRADDLTNLRLLRTLSNHKEVFLLEGSAADELLGNLQHSNNLFFDREDLEQPVLLKASEERQGILQWGANDKGHMRLRVVSDQPLRVVAVDHTVWYLDVANGEIGNLNVGHSAEHVKQWLNMPPLREIDVPAVKELVKQQLPDLPEPDPDVLRKLEAELVPVLVFDTSEPFWMRSFGDYEFGLQELDYAQLKFRYAQAEFSFNYAGEFVTLGTGETVRVARDMDKEKRWLATLLQSGLQQLPGFEFTLQGRKQPVFVLKSKAVWPDFMLEQVSQMRKSGWEVRYTSRFRHHLLEVDGWEADISEDGDGWFSLNMGVIVNGDRIPLAPMLHSLFQEDERWLESKRIDKIRNNDQIELTLPSQGKIKVPAERIKPLAKTLIELFDVKPGESIRISRFDVARISQLADMQRWRFHGMEALVGLAQKLHQSKGINAVTQPEAFGIQLRPYQLEGVAWLQYLREQEIGGILADDMGLGKTAQTLAHILIEKQSGRLDKPCLVVLPTSLIFNWKHEAQRFAPSLKLLSLHGSDRAERFAQIPEADVVLTTYPLLWRDENELREFEYHLLILDEAQTVKNVRSNAAQVVRMIQARHRLCLTGTPMENHLGELWAQFDFLMPGMLGDNKQFTRMWRNPIEKQANQLRQELLSRRVKPFILRRRKDDVASELPPKTIIVRSVDLEGKQRDLYETVRVAMDEKVRKEIASKGFAGSQIVILDALLKLRQVCCDPRLVKLKAAEKVKERAKLDFLHDMLPELVDEGRKILLFSQFTSMLDLIAEELKSLKLDYVKLTGDTQNREQVVQRFQDGEVPVFLISLKAGGVGLNLNMADTVIHFDPWWNPAVENQATDRAHRLGQTKKVFVYKLVVAGSIEEKIIALQDKKAALAEGVLSEDASGLVKFNQADIAALLEPLPVDDN